jgi:yeast amino acid transporter
MCGGNPAHDAYGFRNWTIAGAFAAYIPPEGSLGQFTGFLAAVYSAGFTVVGPEYIAIVAGETMYPRTYIKRGFKTIFWRFGVFFIGSALAVSIVLPWNDEKLQNGGEGTAEGSPYVIAMQNMGINTLPHVVNALLCSSIFSAGNSYVYCAMRSLYGLALDGQAPPIFKKCTKNGIPIYAFAVTMCFPCLSFMSASASAAKVVTWLSSLTQAAQMVNYIIMCITYIFFYKACKAQGLDRNTLPYVGYFQPYCAWLGLGWMCFVVLTYGWTSFIPGTPFGTFFSFYSMVIIDIFTFTVWKVVKRTKIVKPEEADLVWDKPLIDAYEASLGGPPARFRDELLEVFGMKKKKVDYMGGNM